MDYDRADPDGWVAVAGYASLTEAYIGLVALERKRVPCWIPDPACPDCGAVLQVRSPDADRAAAILREATLDIAITLAELRRAAHDEGSQIVASGRIQRRPTVSGMLRGLAAFAARGAARRRRRGRKDCR